MTGNKQIIDVFGIMEIAKISENLWTVRGRVYEILRVGDIVHITDAKITDSSLIFEIHRILVYGEDISEVSKGYSAELILTGENGEGLMQADTLYRIQ